jgi:hypothetical protein
VVSELQLVNGPARTPMQGVVESEGQIDDLYEQVVAEHALGPSGVEIGQWLGGGTLLEGFTLRF